MKLLLEDLTKQFESDSDLSGRIAQLLKDLGITPEQFGQNPDKYIQMALKHLNVISKEKKVRLT